MASSGHLLHDDRLASSGPANKWSPWSRVNDLRARREPALGIQSQLRLIFAPGRTRAERLAATCCRSASGQLDASGPRKRRAQVNVKW